jgi:predicted outer membrane repeat protein
VANVSITVTVLSNNTAQQSGGAVALLSSSIRCSRFFRGRQHLRPCQRVFRPRGLANARWQAQVTHFRF